MNEGSGPPFRRAVNLVVSMRVLKGISTTAALRCAAIRCAALRCASMRCAAIVSDSQRVRDSER